MNCKDYQKKILEEETEAISKHLIECSECRDFANFANETLKLQREKNVLLIPRPETDEKIKAYAREKCKSSTYYAYNRVFTVRALSLAASLLTILATSIFLYYKIFINDPKKEMAKVTKSDNTANTHQNIKWEKLGMEEEIFELTADILLSKELLNYSSINGILHDDSLDEEENFDFDIPFELKI